LRFYLDLVGMRMISSWPSVSTVWATGNKEPTGLAAFNRVLF